MRRAWAPVALAYNLLFWIHRAQGEAKLKRVISTEGRYHGATLASRTR